MSDTTVPLAKDIVRGAKAIAAFTGLSERAVYHQLGNHQLAGAFKMAGIWCLRPSTHLRYITALERGEQPEGAGNGAAKPAGE